MRFNNFVSTLACVLAAAVPASAHAADVTFGSASIFADADLFVYAGPPGEGPGEAPDYPVSALNTADHLSATPVMASFDSMHTASTPGANASAKLTFNGVGTFSSAAAGNFVLSATGDTSAVATDPDLIALAGEDFNFQAPEADYQFDISQSSVIAVTYTGNADPFFTLASAYSIYDVTSDGAGNGSFMARLDPGEFDLQGGLPNFGTGSESDEGPGSDHETRSSSFTFAIAAVPEPATWALMLVGFGALGMVLRSRRPVDSIACA